MGLGRQWEERLKLWDEAFAPNLYQKVGRIDLWGFTTMEHISRERAEAEDYQPFEEGRAWGENGVWLVSLSYHSAGGNSGQEGDVAALCGTGNASLCKRKRGGFH